MDNLKKLISEGRTEKAIKELIVFFEASKPELADDVLLISATFNELKRKQSVGLLSAGDYQVEITERPPIKIGGFI